MAATLPVICIDDESFKIAVIDGYNGLFFHNEKEAKEAIIKLYENQEMRKQIAEQARMNADRYSSKYFASSVLEVYKKAIDKKKKEQNLLKKIWNKIRGKK